MTGSEVPWLVIAIALAVIAGGIGIVRMQRSHRWEPVMAGNVAFAMVMILMLAGVALWAALGRP